MHEVIAKDSNGVKRCYGTSREFVEALNLCREEAYHYLRSRPDIPLLALYCEDIHFATIHNNFTEITFGLESLPKG